jgi:hypothetical protein
VPARAAYPCFGCRQVNQDGKASGGVDDWRRDSTPFRICRTELDRSGKVVYTRHKPGTRGCSAENKDKPRYSRPGARQGHTATLMGDTLYIWGGDGVYDWAERKRGV